jgi:hypothetical protein
MTHFKNVMDVFKLLDKSNCRQCGKPTCLAFAAAVFQGRSELSECPHLDDHMLSEYSDATRLRPTDADPGLEEIKSMFQEKVPQMNLESAAERLGGSFSNGKLALKTLGKNIHIDAKGMLSSDIHLHQWIIGPVLNYLLKCTAAPITGKWVAFRELENGRTWEQFFLHKCEKPFKKLADTYTDLFATLIDLFNGKPVYNHYQSDISLVLHPLPKLPLLICYWKPEEGLGSTLNLFFDSTAEDNLDIQSIYALTTGLVRMFEKIVLRHGI